LSFHTNVIKTFFSPKNPHESKKSLPLSLRYLADFLSLDVAFKVYMTFSGTMRHFYDTSMNFKMIKKQTSYLRVYFKKVSTNIFKEKFITKVASSQRSYSSKKFSVDLLYGMKNLYNR
jgi:hypothetical protein